MDSLSDSRRLILSPLEFYRSACLGGLPRWMEEEFEKCLHAKRQGDEETQLLLRWKMRQISAQVQRLQVLEGTPSAQIE